MSGTPTSLRNSEVVSLDRQADGPVRTLGVLAVTGVGALILHGPRVLGDLVAANGDLRVHYRWAAEFAAALYGGDPYPRWMPLANFGLGEPALLFYAPLYYYATALVKLVTQDTWAAMRLMEFVGIWATGLFAYAAIRRFCPVRWSLAGALTVQAAPMTFMLFHFFNGLPWGLSFTAAMAAVTFSLRSSPRRFVDIPLAVALAAVIGTHTLSGLMMLICLPFINVRYLIGPVDATSRLRPILVWGVSALLGVGLTMVYLFPALQAQPLITPRAWTIEHRPHNAFIFPSVTYFLFGMRWMTFQWPVPLVLLGTVLATTWYLVKTRGRHDAVRASLAGLATVAWMSVFLASELSYPLWELSSSLQLVQFPHRFLYVTTAAGLVANTVCVWKVRGEENYPRRSVMVMALPIVASVLMTAAMYTKFTMIDARPSTFQGEAISPYNGVAEYMTQTVGPAWGKYVEEGGFPAECAAKHAQCREDGSIGRTRRWRISTPQSVTIRLPVFAFPAWSITRDGELVASTLDRATGVIAVEVPPGSHEVALTWKGLASERTGLFLSIGSLAILMALVAVEQLTRPHPPR